MVRHYPDIPFERYADDAICHCRTEEQARQLRTALEERLEQCGLKLHPEKTEIIYCKDDNRPGNYPQKKFDFLGFTFRPRFSRNRWGQFFLNFTPAISNKARKKLNQRMRSWRLHLRTRAALQDLAEACNPVLRGWINYYGSYCRSALYTIARQLDVNLAKWAMRKYKRLRGRVHQAHQWVRSIKAREPGMFAHWHMLSTAGL